MNKFARAFSGRKAFLPVIHVIDSEQALRNAKIAVEAGADGLFLIGHDMTSAELLTCYYSVREALPSFWIGLNFLRDNPAVAQSVFPKDANGLWVDDTEMDEVTSGKKDPCKKARFLAWRDRKSTRLNSSHQIISYAVFCLKKKKNT